MAIIKRAVASAANEKPADGVVKINSIEEPKAKQKAEAATKEPAKKAPAKKAPAKKAATKAPAKKAETAKAPAAKKSATAKTIEKKAAAKAPAKKATAKKPAEKKAPAKSSALKTALTVQYSGRDIRKEDIDKAFEGVWTYDMGRKMSEAKSVEYYYKPEESAVYFVVNGKSEDSGRFEI